MNKGYEKVKDKLLAWNIKNHEKSIKQYYSNPKKCLNCCKTIPYEFRSNRFCSRSCSASYNNKVRIKESLCPTCGKNFRQFKGRKFCSIQCFADNKSKNRLNLWLLGKISGLSGENVSPYVRKYLIVMRGEKCEKCGWAEINLTTGKIPLNINHIDGNYENNVIDNLELLCPNCHSLTSNYGGLNKGNGRKMRRLKRQADIV